MSMMVCLNVGIPGLFSGLVWAGGDLKDHGVPVPLAERRGVVVTADDRGQVLAIACSMDQGPRGWILVTNITTGETVQIYCPEGVANSPAYGSVLARTGKFYTSQGGVLLEFDPTLRQWTFHGTPAAGASAYLVLIEAPDGTIWGGDVYRAGLASFNPQTREMKDHGRMDDQEQYLYAIAVDDAGWVYCGIGTSRGNLVAYHPPTGERRPLVPEEARTVGAGAVYRGVDGKVYGQVALSDGTSHYRLWEGMAERIDEE